MTSKSTAVLQLVPSCQFTLILASAQAAPKLIHISPDHPAWLAAGVARTMPYL